MRRNLKCLLSPRSIAIVGASLQEGKLGYNVVNNVIRGGFPGGIYIINPKYREFMGCRAYSSLEEMGCSVDLVLSVVDGPTSLRVAEDCGQAGVRAMVVYAAGFREVSDAGLHREQKLRCIAKEFELTILGPNTPGFINSHLSLNATFFPFPLRPGRVAIITQSGGIGAAIYRKAMEESLAIGYWVGVGNQTNVDFADLLLQFGADDSVDVLGLYLEGTERGRALIEAAKEVVPRKPVVVLKGGQGEGTDPLTLSHTGSLSGSPEILQGVFRQAGLIQVESVSELVCALKGLTFYAPPQGSRVGILTITGGGSIVIYDLLSRWNIEVPNLRVETQERVKKLVGDSTGVGVKNPLDLTTSGFEAGLYSKVAEELAKDQGVDIVLAMFPVHSGFPLPYEQLIRVKEKVGKPLVLYWGATGLLGPEHVQIKQVLETEGIPVFLMPEEAAWAVRSLAVYNRILVLGGG